MNFLRRNLVNLCLVLLTAAQTCSLAHAQIPDDNLKIYAVNVVKTPPFEKQFNGDGIYLGKGLVITAAHVVGHYPLLLTRAC